MPIIINEFEIITSPPPEPAGQEQTLPLPPAPMSLRPEDVERIQRRQRQRRERVRAD